MAQTSFIGTKVAFAAKTSVVSRRSVTVFAGKYDDELIATAVSRPP